MKLFAILIFIVFMTSLVVAESFEKEIDIAMDAYPELKNIDIDFIEKSFDGRMMVSRPAMNFLVIPDNLRSYEIWINNDFSKNDGYLIYNTSFNATVGLLSHELGHILEYTEMSTPKIVLMAILYKLSDAYKKKVEHRVDDLVVKRGMGPEIYEFTSTVLKSPNSPEKYKEYRRKIYPSPEKIKSLL